VVAYRWPLPSQGQVIAILQGRDGVASGRQWRMEHGKIAIGSASNNDLVLEHDDFVSGHHAWIRAEDHGLYLTDLGSTNGTRVNGVVLKGSSRALLPGDRISLGHAVIEIMAAGPESSHSRASASRRA
jgi:pSer/pThr/pTyr-binding forkhead associated (FHA) protein